jgi:hypothetical protein
VFLVLEPPSIICNIVLVYYLIADRTLRWSLHHHAILALLIVSLIANLFDVPRVVHFLHIGRVIPETEINCLIWQWYDYMIYSHSNVLLLWVSIERYLLIFHGYLFNTVKRRLFSHYLPLLTTAVYIIIFYTIVIFFIPCDKVLDFSVVLCGLPCYTSQLIISLYDNFAHNLLPICFNILLSIALVIRVLYRKRAGLQQPAQRHKHRKMVLQLVLISSIHVACVLPYALLVFIQVVAEMPKLTAYVQDDYVYFFWLLTVLQPFVYIGCLPEVASKVKNGLMGLIRQNNMMTPGITRRLRYQT